LTDRSFSALEAVGLDAERREEFAALDTAAVPGRVIRVDRGMATVFTVLGERRVSLPTEIDIAVGDWVVLDDVGALDLILERRSAITRLVGAKHEVIQVVAANVDLVFLVRPLNLSMSTARIHALLALSYDSGATPVVVLTKADLSDDAASVADEMASAAPGTEILVVSTVTGEGVERVRSLVRGRTVVLVGESGAGKSTLTNLLLGESLLEVGATRDDGQGRHTTSHRELVAIPGGGAVIDTPGVREIVASLDADQVAAAFDDISLLSASCRFSDCRHNGEPGCAIAAALADGTLAPERLAAYDAAMLEAARFERRGDPASRAALKARYRAEAKRRRTDSW